MKKYISKLNPHHIVSVLAAGGIILAVSNFTNQPLFTTTGNFVLFATDEIVLEAETQVSSGDLGSNKKIGIQKDAIINGDLFAKEISIDKNSIINGNASFNKLKLQKDAQILGTKTKPVQLPIANLSEIPPFQIETQDFKFEGESNTLPAGNYKNITINKNSRLELPGGTYNLNKLELEENSILIFNATTTINIKTSFTGKDKTMILPSNEVQFDSLSINYLGQKSRDDKDDDDGEDDDKKSNSGKKDNNDDDEDEEDDDKDENGIKPVKFGKRSILNFKLLAPKAKVSIGKESLLRGQILAKKIKIGKEGILSRKATTMKVSNPADVITDPNGGVYPVNEILIYLTATSTVADAIEIASFVDGQIVGNLSSINLYQLEVPTSKIENLEVVLTTLQALKQADPRILGVLRNFVIPIDRIE